MYKLFLTFRYLTRKKIVVFPILVVWLCVMMLIIVTSIMQGFVDRVRDANRDLYGDIIISSASSSQGFQDYEKLSDDLKKAFPGDIQATTPTVEAYALVYAGEQKRSVPALLVGIDPQQRSQVTRFRQSLFEQYEGPMDAVHVLDSALPGDRAKLMAQAESNMDHATRQMNAASHDLQMVDQGAPGINYNWLWGLALVAILAVREFKWRSGWVYFTGFMLGAILLAIPPACIPEYAADVVRQNLTHGLVYPLTALIVACQLATMALLARRLIKSDASIARKIFDASFLALYLVCFLIAPILRLMAPPWAGESLQLWWLLEGAATGGVLVRLLAQEERHNSFRIVRTGLLGVCGLAAIAAGMMLPILLPHAYEVAEDSAHQTYMDYMEAERIEDAAKSLPQNVTFKGRDELIAALVPKEPSFALPPSAQAEPNHPLEGCIVGSQLLYERDTRGNFEHPYPDTYPKVSITVFPPSKSGRINVQATNAVTQDFTIVDGSHTGVYDIDSLCIYAPFDTVQLMAGMRPDPQLVKDDPTADFPKRAHEILIRLTPQGQTHMKELRAKIDDFVQAFLNKNNQPDLLHVQTWDEKQARYLGAVQNEKTMMTFIMLLMSVVVLVVIFLIFYQIVRDKTRDIGIIKAVGGSEWGVAGIFLTYGLMIGIVGGGLGVLSGWIFVTHTNKIHEDIFQTTGIIIWDRSVYMFDLIPDVAHGSDMVLYFLIALGAGVLGASIPAILAALEDPVQAVRYE